MPANTFFTQTHCDRCGAPLKARTTSWFTTETICVDKCSKAEQEIKGKLPNGGSDHEGCGYIPDTKLFTA